MSTITEGVGTRSAYASETELRLPRAPSSGLLWTRVFIVASVFLGLFLLDRLSALLLNYWLLESMGYASVFWTNFSWGASLFGIGLIALLAVITVPALLHGMRGLALGLAIWIGALGGLLVGYEFAGEYLEFLGPSGLVPFGRTDPVFGHDVSFYIFELPPIRTSLQMGLLVAVVGLVASIATALFGSRDTLRPEGMNRTVWRLGRIATPVTLIILAATGLIMAALVWLGRYDLLTVQNFEDSTEGTGAGADYLDVVGILSTKNAIYVEALAVLALTIGLTMMLWKARRALREPGTVDLRRAFGPAAIALVLLPGITADLAFRAGVAIREQVTVIPNEPVIQLPYLQRHIDATNAAFGMNAIEERSFVPHGPNDPMPDLDALLEDPAIRNAPLWSGFISRYSRRVAPQYVARILLAEGDMTVYAPTLEILQAQQKLRPYYDFLDVDTIVADVDGEPAMLASAVRELPQDIIRPWLGAWGQRSFLYTHGHGLVTMFASERTTTGDPVYGTWGVPIQAMFPSLHVENQSVYYGEGATETGFSNAAGILEHDVATEQGRVEIEFPEDVRSGIVIDSLLKRLVVAYRSGEFVEVLFSGLIDDGTRAHVFRRPLERVEQVAPFLTVDTDPYAVPAQEGIQWMVNVLTTSDAYPYSALALIGEGADLRTEMRPLLRVNYAADAVKAVVDAGTGHVTLYQFSDEPLIATWAQVYPDLFKPADAMPPDLRAQLQYPQALMSIQFNKIYPFYHQRDALTFFSGEDLLDDADEVVGPIRGQSGAITFSQGLYNWMARPGGSLPDSDEAIQFALSKTYSPQDALNLRGIATVYQSGDDYGRLSVLLVPKGHFYLGPEQADAAIDQDAFIAQQIGLWNRLGVEVIRGSTSLLVVENEVLYVEPIFIRSRQNPVPQLQRVIVVFRGQPYMGRDMAEALSFAVEGGRMKGFDDLPGPALTVALDEPGPEESEAVQPLEAVQELEAPVIKD